MENNNDEVLRNLYSYGCNAYNKGLDLAKIINEAKDKASELLIRAQQFGSQISRANTLIMISEDEKEVLRVCSDTVASALHVVYKLTRATEDALEYADNAQRRGALLLISIRDEQHMDAITHKCAIKRDYYMLGRSRDTLNKRVKRLADTSKDLDEKENIAYPLLSKVARHMTPKIT